MGNRSNKAPGAEFQTIIDEDKKLLDMKISEKYDDITINESKMSKNVIRLSDFRTKQQRPLLNKVSSFLSSNEEVEYS